MTFARFCEYLDPPQAPHASLQRSYRLDLLDFVPILWRITFSNKSFVLLAVADVALEKGENRVPYPPRKHLPLLISIRLTGENHPRDWRADPRRLQRKQRNGRPRARRCHPDSGGRPRVSG